MNCDTCRIGRLHPTRAPFLHRLGEEMMVLPDAPAYSCDMCGSVVYDEEFTSQLRYMLDQLTGGDDAADQAALQRHLSENHTSWQSPERSR